MIQVAKTASGNNDFDMAIWQFAFDLMPSSAAIINGAAAARMTRAQLEAVNQDFSSPTIMHLFERLNSMMPEKTSWSPSLRIWGDEKTNDVQVVLGEPGIEGVQFRLDVANLSMPLVAQICSLAQDTACVLVTRDGAIVRPNGTSLIRAVMRSNAARYVRDPERFIREFAAGNPEQI
ncbi:hypothetical protein [Rhizobium sp. ZW T2_16]|uniref:hypothetical protein n=1 Tax=Rhizobium sp. ZW T2_16 TaxID=3378083 RepID=UPI003853AD35